MRSEPLCPELELESERRYLVHANVCLRERREEILRMAERARSRPGDEELVAWLDWRANQLRDDTRSPLFFGRIDGPEPRPCYIGRRYVTDEADEPVVIDWRTDMAARFYRASQADSMEVTRRRRFGFSDDNVMTSFDDEPLTGQQQEEGLSRLVVREIERTHVGPMRDIVATIQPDQDEIVRTELASTLIVQGGPGTGKTAVGLHRAAYLLFEHAKLRRDGVLVVGPSDIFVRYISKVLPALGESQVMHSSVDRLVPAKRKPAKEDPAVAALKGDARMSTVLRKALWGNTRLPDEDVVVRESSPYVRLTPETVRELTRDLLDRHVPVALARTQLVERAADRVRRSLEERGHALTDAEARRLTRAKSLRDLADLVWPVTAPAQVLFTLLSDADALRRAADGVLTDDEQARLLWPAAPASPGRAPWTLADLFLLDEIAGLVAQPPRFGHVVIDEAQDLSPIQLRCIMRRCANSATLLGDMAQRTTPWAAGSWQAVAEHVGTASQVLTLTTSFRVPKDIVRLANALLPLISPELPPTVSGRHVPGAVEIVRCRNTRDALVTLVREAEEHPDSVGVLVADGRFDAVRRQLAAAGLTVGLPHEADDTPDRKVALVPAGLAKGLEFDHVVLLEPAQVVASGDNGLRLLYIALTRAISKLTILHEGELPAPISVS